MGDRITMKTDGLQSKSDVLFPNSPHLVSGGCGEFIVNGFFLHRFPHTFGLFLLPPRRHSGPIDTPALERLAPLIPSNFSHLRLLLTQLHFSRGSSLSFPLTFHILRQSPFSGFHLSLTTSLIFLPFFQRPLFDFSFTLPVEDHVQS
ncbi:hypothetical protein EGR_09973 [Echinococcus granulosus]|uniref:Uncharacterized protein n=1 Tax=Echinococcus granulosus TaxID=6210 RepID=W6U9J9_ECHGR|nr:hypothetical protein EGR_09973 [Echinococcus granulosus]EUB55172.1 hypothetical protein EGR_09973 [Echinococcus granulosus]